MKRRPRPPASDRIAVGGIHAVAGALERDAERIVEVLGDRQSRNPRVAEVLEAARDRRVTVRLTDREELDRHSQGERHQGVIAVCSVRPPLDERGLVDLLSALPEGPALVLVADGVQDPHNLGALLRTADAAGVVAVVIPKDKAVGLTPVARKVASGAAEAVPLAQVTNLARAMERLQEHGFWLIGTSDRAEASVYDTDLTGRVALVVGQEGKGLRRLTMERCDVLVSLPMAGAVSSLNVSVATGVCLFEAVRQRRGASQ